MTKSMLNPIHQASVQFTRSDFLYFCVVIGTIALLASTGSSTECKTGDSNSLVVHQESIQTRKHTQPVERKQIRVGVMPVEREAKFRDVATKLHNKLASQLRGNSVHSVKLKRSDFPTCGRDWVEKGEYPIEALAKANSVYNVDRVLFVRINEWQAFEPMEIGVTLHLVDSHEAQLLVSEDRNWSLQDPAVKEAYRRYLCDRFRCKGDIDIYYRCPTYFCDFVSNQLVQLTKPQ